MTTEIGKPYPPPPANWAGTRPEWAIFFALTRLKVDFDYQSSKNGGRLQRGGVVLDFFIPDRNLAINVQGTYWHYGRIGQTARDRSQRLNLESQGIRVIYIDENDALRNPFFYTNEALNFRDHSKVTR